jgi:hypothetical protein
MIRDTSTFNQRIEANAAKYNRYKPPNQTGNNIADRKNDQPIDQPRVVRCDLLHVLSMLLNSLYGLAAWLGDRQIQGKEVMLRAVG